MPLNALLMKGMTFAKAGVSSPSASGSWASRRFSISRDTCSAIFGERRGVGTGVTAGVWTDDF